MTKENVFTAITRIIVRAAFTFFSTSDLTCAQIYWVLRLQFTRSIVGTHELFSEFPIPPAFACYGEAGHPPVTDSSITFTIVAAALGEFSVLGEFLVLG